MATTKTQKIIRHHAKKKNVRIVEFQDIKDRLAEEIIKIQPLENHIDKFPHKID